ncbi:MAG: hypothetical protein H0U74_09095 [Bradymonadaceae bacterium]|nr:hypothetical protein [Lujinxingiaceae bacterium]
MAFLGALALGAVVLAVPYQAIVTYIPFIYINMLVAAGMGYLLHIGITKAVKAGDCRNQALGALGLCAGAALGLFAAVATHLASYELAFLHLSLFDEMAAEEVDQLRAAVSRADFVASAVDQGWVIGKSGGAPISGVFVWLVWAIEAAIIAGFASFGGWTAASIPFCERCNQWTEVEPDSLAVANLGVDFDDQIKRANQADQLIEIAHTMTEHNMVLASHPDTEAAMVFNPLAIYLLSRCPRCPDSNVLTIKKSFYSWDKNGAETVSDTPLREEVLLTAEDVEALARVRAIKPIEPAAHDEHDEALKQAPEQAAPAIEEPPVTSEAW